eukprot:TRINITY_DN1096_c0_g1_i2.p1 TRINITY_DN1096_c0_g1~~TRINITY_DN1096_c0_g1_i2.p1  ORF type:complete len:705 (+),score=214.81 TRINITY_DN1096_c0_g1_i2:35-2149(+)
MLIRALSLQNQYKLVTPIHRRPNVQYFKVPNLKFQIRTLCAEVPNIDTGRNKRRATKAYLEQKEKKRIMVLAKKAGTVLTLPENISCKNLSNLLGVRTVDLVKILIKLDIPPRSSDELLPPDVVDLIVSDFKRIPVREKVVGIDVHPRPPPGPDDDFPKRPPVVVILGHVNHGKTTLLDSLRKSQKKIVDQEAGGITQHIGAFEVQFGKESITFLDTPGHAAFEQMRERGVKLTDIAILVVDAEKGVQQQTLTSIQYILSMNVPVVVALNKIDKQGARPKKTKQQLYDAGIKIEELGGDVPLVEISALHGHNLDLLKENLLLLAGMNDLKADRTGNPEIFILETKIDKNKGAVSSGIVKCGTVKPNQIFVAGSTIGKIRWLYNSEGKQIKEALPGHPIEFNGYKDKDDVPSPGEYAIVVDDDKKAKEVISYRSKLKQHILKNSATLIQQERRIEEEDQERQDRLDAIRSGIDEEKYLQQVRAEREAQRAKDVNILLKADVSGSIEAVETLVGKLPSDELNVRIIKSSLGDVTEQDVKLAEALENKCLILGFNVRSSEATKTLAFRSGVTIQCFNIIYSLMDWLRQYCSKKLTPDIVVVDVATLVVQEIFVVTIRGVKTKVAGCLIKSGTVKRGSDVQIRRERTKEVVFEGKIRQLRHFKEEVKQLTSGNECGVMFTDDWDDFDTGDSVVCIEKKQQQREFDPQH